MGIASAELSAATPSSPQYSRRGVQWGRISNITVFIASGNPAPSDVYAHVYLTDGDTNPFSAITSFKAGYVTLNAPLIWTGRYLVQGYESIVTKVLARVNVKVRTAINVEIQERPTFPAGPQPIYLIAEEAVPGPEPIPPKKALRYVPWQPSEEIAPREPIPKQRPIWWPRELVWPPEHPTNWPPPMMHWHFPVIMPRWWPLDWPWPPFITTPQKPEER